ncbi:hypothetical protein HERIO_630 [Hepatospora eriocheir]|uniref:Uncharacterized protein n=1 Tax=Hepatospora eriocheir TaxID=1081669 RepID=A0A1X0QCN5_9MICR|nr:hypothetical protein HERIO_630 [Hepatospora eriocheir]
MNFIFKAVSAFNFSSFLSGNNNVENNPVDNKENGFSNEDPLASDYPPQYNDQQQDFQDSEQQPNDLDRDVEQQNPIGGNNNYLNNSPLQGGSYSGSYKRTTTRSYPTSYNYSTKRTVGRQPTNSYYTRKINY